MEKLILMIIYFSFAFSIIQAFNVDNGRIVGLRTARLSLFIYTF